MAHPRPGTSSFGVPNEERELMGRLALVPLKCLAWLYYWLPPGGKRLAGNALGGALRLLGARAKVIQQNLEIAFPGPEQKGRRTKLFREAYAHLGSLTFEILMLLGPMKKFIEEQVEVIGVENAQGEIGRA